MNQPTGLWIYCVIENKGVFHLEAQGIHGTSPVYSVAFEDFAMVVSQEPMQKYPLAREFLMAHQKVIETVMQMQPVLPVRFCTMTEHEGHIIQKVLKQKDKTDEFRRSYARVRGKAEYGLRARWKDLGQVFSDLSREDEAVKIAKEKVLQLPERDRRTALIDIGHLVKDALGAKKAWMADCLMYQLIPHAAEYKENKTLGDVNILHAAFLVENERQARFDEVVNSLAEQYETEIRFKYVGPSPPFHFVEIVIHWDDAHEKTDQHDVRAAAKAGG